MEEGTNVPSDKWWMREGPGAAFFFSKEASEAEFAGGHFHDHDWQLAVEGHRLTGSPGCTQHLHSDGV